MRLVRFARRAFAVHNDQVQSLLRAAQVGDDGQFVHADFFRTQLVGGRADEQLRLAQLRAERRQSLGQHVVKLADGGVVGCAGHQHARRRRACRGVGDRLEHGRVAQARVGRPFQKNEMFERIQVERRQRHLDAGRMIAGGDRQVGAVEVRARANRHGQISHLRQVRHLFHADPHDGAAPARDGVEFFRQQVLVGMALEAEGGVQVAAQEVVFEFGRFGQHVQQVFARAHGRGGHAAVLRSDH